MASETQFNASLLPQFPLTTVITTPKPPLSPTSSHYSISISSSMDDDEDGLSDQQFAALLNRLKLELAAVTHNGGEDSSAGHRRPQWKTIDIGSRRSFSTSTGT